MSDELRLTSGNWPDGERFVLVALVKPRYYKLKRKKLLLQSAICWTPKNDEVMTLDFELSPVRIKAIRHAKEQAK